ncbi:MAG: RHS repeat-associated core domain-containing protein [Methanoregula sp.]|nr:RHS repeat-associated core domain-containing protein [Methanoregula sp.]
MVYPEKLVSLVFALLVLLVTQGPVLAATGNVPDTGEQTAPPGGDFGSPGTAGVFTYDANGNLVNGNGFAYVYDDSNHLREVRFASNNTLIAKYDYDMAGNRVRKVSGNVTTYYLGNLVETRAQDALLKNTSYYFANTERVARQDPDGKKYYYHGDHLGSTSIVTNATGTVVESVAYLPYGETQSRAGSGSTYLYTDQELDPESGLYYFDARYYSPGMMRFVEPDSVIADVNNPQNLNRYSYVLNNPLKYTDPTGHTEEDRADKAVINYLKSIGLPESAAKAIESEGPKWANFLAKGTEQAGPLKLLSVSYRLSNIINMEPGSHEQAVAIINFAESNANGFSIIEYPFYAMIYYETGGDTFTYTTYEGQEIILGNEYGIGEAIYELGIAGQDYFRQDVSKLASPVHKVQPEARYYNPDVGYFENKWNEVVRSFDMTICMARSGMIGAGC